MPRPRNAQFEERILNATAELLAEVGYDALTMNEVARRAGVGKPALYRRFADKGELVMSLTVSSGTPPLDTDTGSFAGDMRVAVRVLAESLGRVPRAAVGAQIGMAIADPEAARRLGATAIEPANAQMLRIWGRAVARGEVRRELDPVVALTAVSASIIHAVLVLHWPSDGDWVEQVAETFLRGVGAAEDGR